MASIEGERIAKLEEALGAAPKKTDQPVGSGDKEPEVHMTLSLFHRRKTMLVTDCMGRLTPAAMVHLADQFNTSVDTLQRDWERKSVWEPFIWANFEANDQGKSLLKQLQLAREVALELMNSPRLGGNARVGAIARFIEAIKTEIELEQSLGLLSKVQPGPLVQNNFNQITAKSETKIMIDLSKMSADDRNALLRAEEALTRAETAAGPQ